MPVNGVGGAGAMNNPATAAPSSMTNGLGQDAFMKLLLAQFQNQDPLRPMEDTAFIAQLAQFNSLNELMSIGKTLGDDQLRQMQIQSELSELNENINHLLLAGSLNQGSAMLGKSVSGVLEDGTEVSGVVTGVKMVDGEVILQIGEESLPLHLVESVTEAPPEEETPPEIDIVIDDPEPRAPLRNIPV